MQILDLASPKRPESRNFDMPNIPIIPQIQGPRYFSALDTSQGFHSLPTTGLCPSTFPGQIYRTSGSVYNPYMNSNTNRIVELPESPILVPRASLRGIQSPQTSQTQSQVPPIPMTPKKMTMRSSKTLNAQSNLNDESLDEKLASSAHALQ